MLSRGSTLFCLSCDRRLFCADIGAQIRRALRAQAPGRTFHSLLPGGFQPATALSFGLCGCTLPVHCPDVLSIPLYRPQVKSPAGKLLRNQLPGKFAVFLFCPCLCNNFAIP